MLIAVGGISVFISWFDWMAAILFGLVAIGCLMVLVSAENRAKKKN